MIIDKIAGEAGVDSARLLEVAMTAEHRYRTYQIPKRKGGLRTISHPTPRVKFLQRWLNRNVFIGLPVHHTAFAYRRGVGIADNAKKHVENSYLLKIDFADFFPSLTARDVRTVLRNNKEGFSFGPLEDELEVIVSIVCRKGALTIGAPSSPILANAIMYEFDTCLYDFCHTNGIVYTRYADDIFLSTKQPNVLSGALKYVRRDIASRESPRLCINEAKTVFTSKKRRRLVTGLVLTSDGRISIGRRNKRKTRSQVYSYLKGGLDKEDVLYLKGYLAFAESVEPEFVRGLSLRYGEDILAKLQED